MTEAFLTLTDSQKAAFETLYGLMVSSPVNITSVKTKNDYYIKHVLDSLYFFNTGAVDMSGITSLADIGSGGGFPGLAVAICHPQIKVSLVESISKKCRYLESAVSALNLNNVTVLNSRVEKLSGLYDIAAARGVGTVAEVWKLTRHLVKKGWLMYKGERLAEELAAFEPMMKKEKLRHEILRVEKPFTRSYLWLYRA